MDYKKKYLKYKNKYEKLKGGVIVFNNISTESGNLNTLLNTYQSGENLIYSQQMMMGNSFDKSQKKSIEAMINFFFANINYKEKQLGLDMIKEINTLGSGSFGTTISYNDLIIKIYPYKQIYEIHKEIENLENIFHTGIVVPDSINKYYGFISGKNILNLLKYNSFDNTQFNFVTNLFNNPLFKFNIDKFITKITKIDPKLKTFFQNEICNNLIFTFHEKADNDLGEFINVISLMSPVQKLQTITKLILDINTGLKFLHKNLNSGHFDIKLENIVYKIQPDGTYNFQIIDFGSIYKLNLDGKAIDQNIIYTPTYYNNTIHVGNFTYTYDYFCLGACVMQLLLGIYNDMNEYNNIIDIAYLFFERNNSDINLTIDNFITNVNSINSIYNLPDAKSNPELYNDYKIVLKILFLGGQKPNYIPLNSEDYNTLTTL
jgi:hypothetical protein